MLMLKLLILMQMLLMMTIRVRKEINMNSVYNWTACSRTFGFRFRGAAATEGKLSVPV